MNQKGFAPLLIVVLILAALVGGYLVYQNQPKPTPQPQPTTQPLPTPDASPAPTGAGETANWKTYTNRVLGYEFKYPSSLNLIEKNFNENKDEQYKIVLLTDMNLAEPAVYPTDDNILVQATNTQASGTPAIYKGFLMDIRVIPSYTTIDPQDKMHKKLNINGVDVYKDEDSFKSNEFEAKIYRVSFIKEPWKKQFEIVTNFNASKKEYFEIFNSIISSFKITN